MSERKITLGDALLHYTMREIGREEGKTSFDRFVDAASVSHIPKQFMEAAGNVSDQVPADLRQRGIDDIDEVWKEQARRIFETDFRHTDEGIYAIQYSIAIAMVKKWSAANNQLAPIISAYQVPRDELEKSYARIAARLGCQPSEARQELIALAERYDRSILDDVAVFDRIEAGLDSMKPTLEQGSQLLSVQRSLAEQACGMVVVNEEIAKGKDRTPVQKTKLRVKQAVGNRVKPEDYARVRDTVETYFANPQKVARIQILAQPRRK